ncbi:MAG TPA: VWA domain-containing protein, partial [Vicinamibacteria bacterium]
MRRIGFALALFGLLAGSGLAQDSARGRQPAEPVFRTEVDHVEIDAFVMDAKGEFLRGLTRDDFEVFEEGVRQDITAFAEISIPIERPEEKLPGGVALPRDTATNEEAFGGRVYVFLLDAAHTDPRRAGRVRELASQFIEERMEADDIGAVVVTGGGVGQTFTSDKQLLIGAVGRFTGRKPASATVERLDLIEFQRDT